jgi:hypothetical protein
MYNPKRDSNILASWPENQKYVPEWGGPCWMQKIVDQKEPQKLHGNSFWLYYVYYYTIYMFREWICMCVLQFRSFRNYQDRTCTLFRIASTPSSCQVLSPWLGYIVDSGIGLSSCPPQSMQLGGPIRQPYTCQSRLYPPFMDYKNLATVLATTKNLYGRTLFISVLFIPVCFQLLLNVHTM